MTGPEFAPLTDDKPARWTSSLPGGESARYDYRDAGGEIAFAVLRRDGPPRKRFAPYTPEKRGDRDGWRTGYPPGARPLYRLPELLAAEAGEQVLVVEGEKCADAVAAALPAVVVTTWASGSSAWRKTDWSPLAGRRVLLIADADEPGRKAVRDVAAHLAPSAAEVRIALPEGDDGHDVADEIEAGGWEGAGAWLKALARPFPTATPPPAAAADGAGAAAVDPKSPDADRAVVEAARADPGAIYEAPHLETGKAAWNDPARKARLRAALGKVKDVRLADVDKAYDEATDPDADQAGAQGRPVEYDDPEPWPDPVDGAALLDRIAATVRRFVEMPEARADAVALWIVHTWIHVRLGISTFLNVTSATKRCGKTLLMEVVGALAWRSLPVSGRVTPAALFRIVERDAPTLILDEADTFFADDPELRGIVNGSQRRDSAFVLRCVGDDHEPRRFGTWCPKAIAGIGGLPDTTLDRALVVRLERRDPAAGPLPGWRDRDPAAIDEVRRRIARWVGDGGAAILEARARVAFPPGLHDRARDAWEALLAIGDAAGGEWAGPGGRAWRAAEAARADAEEDTGAREMLLADLHAVFAGKGDPAALATVDILAALHEMEGRPWSEWRRGKPLSTRGLASLLKPFKIGPGTVRPESGGTPKGYKRAQFAPLWVRYAIDPGSVSATTPQALKNKASGDFLSATSPEVVADTNGPNPLEINGCGVVADTPGGPSEGTAPDDPDPERAAIMGEAEFAAPDPDGGTDQ